MRVHVEVFAQLKDYFEPGLSLSLEESATVSDVMEALVTLKPEAKAVLEASRVAMNEAIVEASTPLSEGQELFILPPASGG